MKILILNLKLHNLLSLIKPTGLKASGRGWPLRQGMSVVEKQVSVSTF